MQSILRLFLALSVVIAAVAYSSDASFACDYSRVKSKMKSDESFFAEVIGGQPKGKPVEMSGYNVSSPPLREKPRSDFPIALAIGVAGTAVMMLLRRRKASMFVMGASLVGLCAAIGYVWNSF